MTLEEKKELFKNNIGKPFTRTFFKNGKKIGEKVYTVIESELQWIDHLVFFEINGKTADSCIDELQEK